MQADAFESLLLRAGLDDLGQLPSRERPLDRAGAMHLLALLLDKPLPLRSFPQRMGACFLLREVLESGEVSREELNRRADRFRSVAVLRPDGYLAWVLDGHTQQKAGNGHVEFRDGVFQAQASGFILGRFYSGRSGVYRPVDAQMRPLEGSIPMADVYQDADVVNRVLDGVQEAFFALAMGIGKFLSQPLDSVAALKDLPAGVAALIASSPEYLERFKLMTTGEQVQAVSKLTTTLITMFAGWGAVPAGVTRGLGGMEVAGLSLSAQGTLALSRVVIPAGEAVAVLAGGAGTAIVFHQAGTSRQVASGFQGSRRSPLANAPYQKLQNGDVVIGGRTFSGHALDQMRNRGLTPSVVENTIRTGIRSADPSAGRLRFFDPTNSLTVVTEGERVVTVVPGRLGR